MKPFNADKCIELFYQDSQQKIIKDSVGDRELTTEEAKRR